MNSVDGERLTNAFDNYKNTQPLVPQYKVKLLVETLPEELIQEVFSFLEVKDLLPVNRVNRNFNQISVKAEKRKLFSPTVESVKYLYEKLDKKKHENQVEKLFLIEKDARSLSFLSLGKLSRSFMALQDNTVNVLRLLEGEDVNNLKNLSKGEKKHAPFLKNLFNLVRIYKKIDEANSISDQDKMSTLFEGICRNLTKMNRVNRALEVTDKMVDGYIKFNARYSIFKVLMEMNKIDKIIETYNVINRGFLSYLICRSIFEKLKDRDEVDVIIKIFNGMMEDGIKYIAFRAVFGLLTDNDEEIIKLIADAVTRSNTWKNGFTRWHLVKDLTNSGNFTEAIKVANKITNDWNKKHAVTYIYFAVAASGNCDEALKISNTYRFGIPLIVGIEKKIRPAVVLAKLALLDKEIEYKQFSESSSCEIL